MSTDFYDFPEGHTPRKGRILTSGVILTVMGLMLMLNLAYNAFSLVMISAMPTTFTGPAGSDVPPQFETMMGYYARFMAANVVMMAAQTALLLTVGFGSIFLKRWSRPFALTLAWGWLYGGVSTIVVLILISPGIRRLLMRFMEESDPALMGGGGPNPLSMLNLFLGIYIAILFAFGVLFPGLMVWLNWHRDTRVTLEFCDPKPRWTDRCPVPVFGLAAALAFGAVQCLPAMIFQWFPLFNRLLTGWPATFGIAALAALLLGIAWLCYRVHIAGWAAALLLILTGAASTYVSIQHIDLVAFATGLAQSFDAPASEMAEMEKILLPIQEWLVDGHLLTSILLATVLAPLGYLFWVLRYFFPARGGEKSAPAA